MTDGQATFAIVCVVMCLLYFVIHGIVAICALGWVWKTLAILFGLVGVAGVAYGIGVDS